MSIAPIDWDAVRTALDHTATAVAARLRQIPDAATRVPGLEWSAGELGAHLVSEARRFERFANGGGDPLPTAGVAGYNAKEIAEVGETDLRRLADLFEADHAIFAAHAARQARDDPFTWFDAPITWAEAGCIYLGELAVHSFDLGRSVGRKYKIDRAAAIQISYGLLSILQSSVDQEAARGFKGTFELKLRGAVPIVLSFDDGKLMASPSNGTKVDCKISADPEAFLLVGYGRISQWGPILRGKLIASGRKPWLGLKFSRLLLNP
ncbi:MAG: maleylpyruvate isomerase family mycothiol-dependent enzyme [Actinomycetota bacterium]